MKKYINWNKEILPYIVEQLGILNNEGITPTLRGMYYRLLTFNIFKGIKDPYGGLSSYTGRLRKRSVFEPNSKLPKLPIDCFADSTRGVIRRWSNYKNPEKYIAEFTDGLISFPETYIDSIPRWYNQPHYVEIWVEKRALSQTIERILDYRQVRIVPMAGYSSIPFMDDNMNRLEQNVSIKGSGLVHVLYLGDLDPTGENIVQVIKANLREYEIEDHVDFQQICVLDEQRIEYNLPVSLDYRSQLKLKRDPRRDRFIRKRGGGEAYQVEVDALFTLQPDVVKRLILEPIDDWFKQDIYDEVMARKEHSEESLQALQKREITRLYNEVIKKKSKGSK